MAVLTSSFCSRIANTHPLSSQKRRPVLFFNFFVDGCITYADVKLAKLLKDIRLSNLGCTTVIFQVSVFVSSWWVVSFDRYGHYCKISQTLKRLKVVSYVRGEQLCCFCLMYLHFHETTVGSSRDEENFEEKY